MNDGVDDDDDDDDDVGDYNDDDGVHPTTVPASEICFPEFSISIQRQYFPMISWEVLEELVLPCWHIDF